MAETDLIRTPLYEQLKVVLQELIGSDEYKVEDKFLSERQICERFDVSRATANKAMSSLLTEGILEFRKGIGTFIVNQSPIDKHFHENLSFTNKTLAMGQKPSTKILDFYGTTEIVASTGNFTYGVHEADDTQAAIKAVKLIEKSIEDK